MSDRALAVAYWLAIGAAFCFVGSTLLPWMG